MRVPTKKIYSNLAYTIIILGIACAVLLFYTLYINEPLFGWYGSREVQTAITAYWFDFHHLFKSIFFYETPVFGCPWSLPFEFPLFQLGAAGIHSITGLPLDVSGRFLNALLYFCCFIPLYKIIKELEISREYFCIATILFLLSPIYLYWSRTFLIESSALLTGFLFLWSSICFSKTSKIQWLVWTLFFGVLCSLVKITTFPSFVLAALLASIAVSTDYFSRTSIKQTILQILPLLMVLALCYISVKLWTEHADSLKEKNLIADILTSKNLQGWNFGNFPQRFSSVLWKDTITNRIVPHTIGSISCLFVIALGILFGDNKQRGAIICLLSLFIAPILIFTNLHIVHDYYQYANSFWLILSLAFAIYIIKTKKSQWLGIGLLVFVCYAELSQYQNFYKKFVVDINASREDSKNTDRLNIANKIRCSAPSNSIIVVFGEEWYPEIPYYSERKAIMIPRWLTQEQTKKILENNHSYDGFLISGIVINNNDKSLNTASVKDFLLQHQDLDQKITIGCFDLYMHCPNIIK